MLEIGLTEDDNDASFLISKDEEEDDIFVAPAEAALVYQQGGRQGELSGSFPSMWTCSICVNERQRSWRSPGPPSCGVVVLR